MTEETQSNTEAEPSAGASPEVQSSATDAQPKHWINDILEETPPSVDNAEAEVDPRQELDPEPKPKAELETLEMDPTGSPDSEELEEEVEEASEGEIAEEVDAEEVPTLTLYDAEGNEFEAPADALLKVTVDGKEELVSIQDFANSVSGQQALSRRFTELDQERKALQAKREERGQLVQQMSALMNEGKVIEALEAGFRAEGYDPALAMTGLFQQITPYLDRYAAMQPQERLKWANDLRTQRQQLQLKAMQEYTNKLQASQAQFMEAHQVKQKLGLNDETYSSLEQALMRENKGKQPTPGEVEQFAHVLTREIWIKDALQQHAPEMAKNQQYITTLAQQIMMLENQGYEITPELLAEVARNTHGQGAKVEASKKVTQKLARKGQTPMGNKPPASAKSEASPKRFNHWFDEYRT